MEKCFSKYLKDNHDLLKEIVNKLSKKFSFVSILASDVVGQTIKVSNKDVVVGDSSWNERGFVVRVYLNGLYSEYSFNKLDNVNDIVNKIIESSDVKTHLEKAIYVKCSENDLYEEDKIIKDFSRIDEFEDMETNDIIKLFKKTIAEKMEINEYIISANMSCEKVFVSKTYISNRKDISQVYSWANARFMCLVNKDEVNKFNYDAESSVSLVEAINKVISNIDHICEDANELLDSTYVEPGEYECITTPVISGLIAHEAFGHGVEMDMFVKNRALGAKYINKRVGSDLVEMHEGALPYNDVASYFFDDEGTLACDTVEIKDGILLTGVADALSATKLNIKPTGNGRRENYQHKAYSRMTNTYFSSKNDKLEDMIKSIKYGFLIDGEQSGMEDPKNWGIQCIAILGKEIKDGKLTGKIVSPLIITGYVLDLLNSVSMVSDDFALYGSGACGKGYKEWVKTSVGGPYLKAKVKLG